MRLVLASASPRRRELLQSAGIAFDVDPVDVDEQRWPEELPRQYVERVARAKAEAAQRKHPDRPVVAADTAVIVDGDVLGKPRDAGDAAGMLRRLAGRHHQVLTGLAVGFAGGLETDVEETTVWFTTMSDDDIASYVASGEPMDKAGAYAIQGLASRFISRIDGSYSNVVGLPVATLVQLLTRAGVPPNLS